MGRVARAGAKALSLQVIERRIYLIRGQKVMLDNDLAELYQVQTKRLNEAVRRNRERFPGDFMFQLTKGEYANLRPQSATSSYGGRRYLPYAFTEQGVAMLSSVLNSARAVQMNIMIMRAFVRLREIVATNKSLARKLKELEEKYKGHEEQLQSLFETLQELIEAPAPPRRRIGFVPDA